MKIAIFTNNYLPNPYGVSGSIESFRREFEKNGHTVYIFAPKTKGYIDDNQNVFRYPAIDFNYKISFPLAIPFSKRIDKILENLEIDIIHSQHPNLLGWAARRWAKKKNVPLVFTWHTLYDQYAHFSLPFIPKKFARWWTINNAVKYANLADVVIVPTESVAPIIQSWGVINEIVSVATGVVEGEFTSPDRNIIREKYGIKENEILLLLVSRLTEEKNIHFILETAIEILKKSDKAKVMFVGEGYLLPELRAKTKKENLGGRIIFSGLIGKNDLKNYYAAGDIFICASKSETQGMNVSEAMYAGLPIVAVNAPGISSLVENGRNGALVLENSPCEIATKSLSVEADISQGKVEFAAVTKKLIDDDILRAEMASQSAKIAREKYTAAICAEKMLEVYKKAIENKNDSKEKLLQ